jgi:hypothetical protein
MAEHSTPVIPTKHAAQRTRLYQSGLEIDRGVFATVAIDAAALSVYGFDLDGGSSFVMIGLAFDL